MTDTEAARAAKLAYKARNREKIRAEQFAYRTNNPHIRWERAYRERCHRYGLPVVLESFTRAELVALRGDRCHWCKTGPFEELDHIVAVRDGGPHTLLNCVPSCTDCNVRREREARQARAANERATTCANCGESFVLARTTARFCSTRCRVAHHRAVRAAAAIAPVRPPGVLPRVLTDRDQWVRWRLTGHRGRKTKLPVTLDGRMAAVNRPDTWTTYRAAKASTIGDGLGFVLTRDDDISCIDLDDVLTNGKPHPALAEFIAGVENVFLIEVSPSGDGLHIWHHGPVGPNSMRVENGMKVERYHWGRYITITGTPYTP